jgi:hypothetical protein
VVALLAAVFAGCVSDELPGEPGPGNGPPTNGGAGPSDLAFKPARSNSLEQQLGAIETVAEDDPEWARPAVTERDWLLLTTPMGPTGAVTVYRWEFPPEAVKRDLESGAEILPLDFVIALDPMGSPAGLPEGIDWLLAVFYERSDTQGGWRLNWAGERFGATMEVRTRDSGGSPSTVTRPAESGPFVVNVPAASTMGDEVYFVLAARGPPNQAFGMGVRMLSQEYAGLDQSPTADWPDFRNLAGDSAPIVPERLGTGEGLYMAWYLERVIASQGGLSMRAVVDTPEPVAAVPTEVASLFTTRVSTLTSEVSWGGMSLISVRYSNVPNMARWEISGNIHGESVSKSGFIDNIAKSCWVVDEGGQGSSLENTITSAWAFVADSVYYQHFSVGLELEPLVGLPLRSEWAC